MKRILGIDPGAGGGIALLIGEKLASVHDMPTIDIKGRRHVLAPSLAALFRELAPDHAFVELVGPMPRDGHVGAFRFGEAFGIIKGVIGALALPSSYVTPAVWKPAMRAPADKGKARARACQLFPAHAASFARVRDDGRAEAALIALWGYGSTHKWVEW